MTAADAAAHAALDVHPVAIPLQPLFPHAGLPRGQWVGVSAPSLMLALLARPSQDGAWCAVVGVDGLGLAAAQESGVALERLVVIPRPGPRWPDVLAALIDAFDIVAIRTPSAVSVGIARRLQARVRQRRGVVVLLDAVERAVDGIAVDLRIVEEHWEGIGAGAGSLRARRVRVAAQTRGTPRHGRPVTLWLPDPAVAIAADEHGRSATASPASSTLRAV
ncbi:MAG: hypothetical protein WD011_05850 [Nitriliruptoraceae bacterium]